MLKGFSVETPTSINGGIIVSFICCGIKYTKNNPETYWCLQTDVIKPQAVKNEVIKQIQDNVTKNMHSCDKKYKSREFIKKSVNGKKVQKEVVESLICKKCGCHKIKITRYGINKKRLEEPEVFGGYEVTFYLNELLKLGVSKILPQIEPFEAIPSAKNIPFVFGSAISPTEQRKRYDMSPKCWADKWIKGPFNITKDVKIPGYWEADTIESKIKISKINIPN